MLHAPNKYRNIISNEFLGEGRLVMYLLINFWETAVLQCNKLMNSKTKTTLLVIFASHPVRVPDIRDRQLVSGSPQNVHRLEAAESLEKDDPRKRLTEEKMGTTQPS